MSHKGFRRVLPEQSRAAAVLNLRRLRDEAVRIAKNAINEGDWQAALDCLYRAEDYERRACAMKQRQPMDPRGSGIHVTRGIYLRAFGYFQTMTRRPGSTVGIHDAPASD